jgi:hypothetical protein
MWNPRNNCGPPPHKPLKPVIIQVSDKSEEMQKSRNHIQEVNKHRNTTHEPNSWKGVRRGKSGMSCGLFCLASFALLSVTPCQLGFLCVHTVIESLWVLLDAKKETIQSSSWYVYHVFLFFKFFVLIRAGKGMAQNSAYHSHCLAPVYI